MEETETRQTKIKLQIAIAALAEIRDWNENIRDDWGDPGERAKAALEAIRQIKPKTKPNTK